MKVLVCFILMLSMSIFLSAQDLLMQISPPTQYYNTLRISCFDFQVPGNQPTFFTIDVENVSGDDIENPYMYYSLSLNADYLIDEGTRVRYRHILSPAQKIVFTNRDILTENDSYYFSSPQPQYSAYDVLERIPEFRDTVLNTGLFPDGDYVFTAQFRDANGQPLSNQVSQTIIVRNPGGIFLISPGVALGGSVPSVSNLPVNFLWSSNLASSPYNPFRLTIKEFEDQSMLNPDYIEGDGHTIIEIDVTASSYYSDFIPMQDGKYYAWQITTNLLDPSVSEPPEISSPINVFRYTEDSTYDHEATMNSIRIYLLSLNIPWVTQMLNNGHDPTGIINYNGTELRGSGAENLIHELRERQVINVKLVD